MKVKTKLIASIMSICLVCAVFAIGVFALKNANLKIGGDVSFTATGVEAHIKNASVTGSVTQTTLAANDAEGEVINTSMTQADIDTTFANWSDIELDFDENATDIELKFEIANTSTNADNYIEIDYSYSFSNSSPNVDVFPGDENAQKVWENNNYILAPKGATPAAGDYETFTLKFKVLDKELNVPQDTKVNLTITLKHTTPKTATATNNVVTIDNISYTLNSPSAGFATVRGLTTGTSAVIYPVVKEAATNAVPCVVTSIGDRAFWDHSGFASITIPSSVTNIGEEAFYYCSSLTSITIPSSVTSIGDKAFYHCSSLTSITIPASITSIGSSAFYDCTGLTSITIPSSVTNIGDTAFKNSGLISITILSSVPIIGESAFDNTPWYENKPDGLIYINNVLYRYKGTMPVGTSIEVKEGTILISFLAFYSCSNLISITIPSSVTTIGAGAFLGCESLTSITIPSSVTIIGAFAFSYTGLISANFENPTGWFKVASADETSGTPVSVTSTFTEDNANVLKGIGNGEYLLRKDA